MKLITKETFKKIFATYYNKANKRLFVRVHFGCGIIYVNLGHLYWARQDFEDKILKIGFHRWGVFFRLEILPQYIESVKNLFLLAISDDKSNVELAYQISQNIRQYAILETPEPIVEVPKPIETPPEKVDFSKYQLGNRKRFATLRTIIKQSLNMYKKSNCYERIKQKTAKTDTTARYGGFYSKVFLRFFFIFVPKFCYS